MTSEDLRDLRAFILRELYRVNPRGRTAGTLRTIARAEVPGELADFEAQLTFLQGRQLVEPKPADALAPGLPPFWFITADGMGYAEKEHLV